MHCQSCVYFLFLLVKTYLMSEKVKTFEHIVDFTLSPFNSLGSKFSRVLFVFFFSSVLADCFIPWLFYVAKNCPKIDGFDINNFLDRRPFNALRPIKKRSNMFLGHANCQNFYINKLCLVVTLTIWT